MAKKIFFKQTASVGARSVETLLEVKKPSKFTNGGKQSETSEKRPLWWRRWFLLTGISVFLASVVIIVAAIWWYVSRFEATSGISVVNTIRNYREQYQTLQEGNSGPLTFLILGLDQSHNQRETSLLTDSMIVAHYEPTLNQITLTSLPRDLWIESLQTRINALYYYGQQANPEEGMALVRSVVNEITGYSVDHYVLITMDSLASIVDALGGVDVEVENSFVDVLYPREIDLSSKDPAVLYETVSFTKGVEHMDGARALQYIRSRHSEDDFEGTDEGRERRQQVLLASLRQALMEPRVLTNPVVLGNLYRTWKEQFISDLDDTTALFVAQQLWQSQPQVESRSIPIQDEDNSGILYHPEKGPMNQWVYLPVADDWQELRDWFSQ